MGRPDPNQADHRSNPHSLESDDTTCGNNVPGEYPQGQANMINQNQQIQSTTPFPPAQRPAAGSQIYPPPQQNQYNVNIPGGVYPPQAQLQPQMYPPVAGNCPPQQQQYQMPVQFPPMNPPPQQHYQMPVQFPLVNNPPQVYQQTMLSASQHQFNGSITEGVPMQQQQTYPSVTPMVSSNMPKVGATNEWTTGLCDCMDNFDNTIITCLCPCLTFGQIAEILNKGNSSCWTCAIVYILVAYISTCPCLLTCKYRTKLRKQFNLEEAPAPDWVVHFFCECCALCQAHRELSNRGLDPSIGWHGNQKRMRKQQQQQQAQEMMAPRNQTMMQ